MGNYAIRKVYVTGYGVTDGVAPTAKELSDTLSKQVTDFFGGVRPTKEQLEALSAHITVSAIRWVNDEFELGINDE